MEGTELEAFIDRIESLEQEKKGLSTDIRDIFAEAKDKGYDPKIMKLVLKLRKLSDAERSAHQTALDTYLHALDM